METIPPQIDPLCRSKPSKFSGRAWTEDPGGCWDQDCKIATTKSKFERQFGTVASIGETGVSVEINPLWRGITQACLSNYVSHFHGERNHQDKGNVILFPEVEDRIGESNGQIQKRERLGALLKFCYREAA
jgi:hypothetical protein